MKEGGKVGMKDRGEGTSETPVARRKVKITIPLSLLRNWRDLLPGHCWSRCQLGYLIQCYCWEEVYRGCCIQT